MCVLFWVYCSLCCSVYCLCVNVYCTSATGCQRIAVNHTFHLNDVCTQKTGQRGWRLLTVYLEVAEIQLDSSWNVMAHGDTREGKCNRNRRMEWVPSTLHTTSEHGVSSITTADPHTSAASSRMYWRPRRFKCTRSFRRKTKSGFCACAITFQPASTWK